MSELCLIFDLDGTLVDSEGLCNQAFLDLLPELNESSASLSARYRGRKLAAIMADIELRIRRALPGDFEAQYRARLDELFDSRLQPVAGVHAMLQATTCSRCVASSAPRQKIEKALQLTGLSVYFGNCIFSSYEVGSWKPDPQLFLHAAAEMGFGPSHCVVVEDSEVGVQAALSAGMRVLMYTPECGQRSVPCPSFSRMEDLPTLLSRLTSA
jgi:HAD superfamily hydrolase (TIGR01509 family)